MVDLTLMTLLDAGLRGTDVALLLLLAAVLRRDRPRLPAARAGVAMTLGLFVQVVSSAPPVEALLPRLWQAPLVAISVSNGVLFWIFVQALFDDDFALRPAHVAAWLGAAVLSGFNCAVAAGSGWILAPVAVGLQRSVPLVCAVLAAVAAASRWNSDLVEPRRRLRSFIVVAGVAYTVAMLLARLASPQGQLSNVMATVDVAILGVILAVVAVHLLHLGGSELFPSARGITPPRAVGVQAETAAARVVPTATTPPPADPAEERLAGALQHLMAVERAYLAEDLSVGSVAARLAVPEYRLRRLINRGLGYRNFSAYVNGFRLDEARSALADPARRELPVLSIALEAGFQSIGPFNRAFKAATGLTPSEFRREKLADS